MTVDLTLTGNVCAGRLILFVLLAACGGTSIVFADQGEIRQMLMPSKTPFVAAVMLSTFVGCTTMQNMGSSMKSLVSRQSDPKDPLAEVAGETSPTYKTAKRELKAADETLLKFAQWREDLGDLSESMERYREILRENPESVDARLGIARIEYKTGRVHEAEEILKATARQHPENLAVWIEMGRIQTEREQYATAVETLSHAVKLDPNDQSARFQLGLALAKTDRLEEAQPHLAFAVGESAAMFNIGYVLQEAGRSAESVVWLEKALQSFPDERTQRSASQMLAQIQSGANADIAARNREPAKVDIAATSYMAYNEVPGQPVITPGASSANYAAGNIPGSSDMQVQALGQPRSIRRSTPAGTPANFAGLSRPAAGGQASAGGLSPTAHSPAAHSPAVQSAAHSVMSHPGGTFSMPPAAAQPANGLPTAVSVGELPVHSSAAVRDPRPFIGAPAIMPGTTGHSQTWQPPAAATPATARPASMTAQPAFNPSAGPAAPAGSSMVEPAPWRGGI